jgi:hypothetical protein
MSKFRECWRVPLKDKDACIGAGLKNILPVACKQDLVCQNSTELMYSQFSSTIGVWHRSSREVNVVSLSYSCIPL